MYKKDGILIIILVAIVAVILVFTGWRFVSYPKENNNKTTKSMAKELSYEEASELALRLANEEFEKKQFKDSDGVLVKAGFNFLGKKEGGRWIFSEIPPAGVSASVSFELDGSDPVVEVGWTPY